MSVEKTIQISKQKAQNVYDKWDENILDRQENIMNKNEKLIVVFSFCFMELKKKHRWKSDDLHIYI